MDIVLKVNIPGLFPDPSCPDLNPLVSPEILFLTLAGSKVVSLLASVSRELASSALALPFSKILVNDLTIGVNSCFCSGVIRLVEVRGKTPKEE